jgi:hypothetical protein
MPGAGVPRITDQGSLPGASSTVHDEQAGSRVLRSRKGFRLRRTAVLPETWAGTVVSLRRHDASPRPRHTGPALEAMHVFLRWAIPTVERFPRSQKFLLADRIQTIALDAVERLIAAANTRERRGLLDAAN